jgi:hypothetical protein
MAVILLFVKLFEQNAPSLGKKSQHYNYKKKSPAYLRA